VHKQIKVSFEKIEGFHTRFGSDGRKTPGWIKSWLNKEGFVDTNYQLTKKGKKVKRILTKMKKEVE